MDRRKFLKGTALVAGAMCVDLPLFSKAVKDFGKGNLKIGILSDIHIKTVPSGKAKASWERFEKALRFYRSQNVDGVLIAGDMADDGTLWQLKKVAEIWYSVFPDDKAPDGHKVEKLFIYGNHDIEAWKYSYMQKRPDLEEVKADALAKDRAASWKECFHEDWAPIYTKEIKGYKFIGGHFVNNKRMPGLDEYLKKEKLPKGKPFFYFQHCHPKGTCSAPWTWGQDNGEVTEILSNYPNCIAFSGHSHTPLVDERTIWQGGFVSVGTASLSYLVPFGGRENSKRFGDKSKTPSQMPEMPRDAHNGQLMTVYNDYITLERFDMERETPVGGNWIIPISSLTARPSASGEAAASGKASASLPPLSFEARAKKAVAPQFGPDTEVSITQALGANRYKVEQEQITVHFPTVKGGGKSVRAFDYEVQIEVQDVDVAKAVLTKRVYSNGYFKAASAEPDEAICVFGVSEIPTGVEYRFAVRPCECFGKKGEPIYSKWQTPVEAGSDEVGAPVQPGAEAK